MFQDKPFTISMLFSNFPGDIFEEISEPDWTSLNSQQGSYQTITPSFFHMVHPYLVISNVQRMIFQIFLLKDIGLTFSEFVIIKSVFRNTVVDTIFIHAQTGSLNSSLLDNLLGDPMYNEKIFVIDVELDPIPSSHSNARELSDRQCTSVGLKAVTAFGGFYLKVYGLP